MYRVEIWKSLEQEVGNLCTYIYDESNNVVSKNPQMNFNQKHDRELLRTLIINSDDVKEVSELVVRYYFK